MTCQCALRQPCAGLRVEDIPLGVRSLADALYAGGKRFIERMQVRGFEYAGRGVRWHGPWVSYDFNQNLVDAEAAAWVQAEVLNDPSLVLPFVISREATVPYSDYVLVAGFIFQDRWTDIPLEEL